MHDTLAVDMKPIRICLVGGGLIWKQVHSRNMRRGNETFEVTGICARSRTTRKAVVEEFAGAREYSSLDELFEADSVGRYDALLVLTPIPLNASVAIRALEHGKIVFVEKPVAMSEAECAALEVAGRRASVPLYILENNAYDSRFKTAADIVRSGRIGTPISARRVTHLYLGGDRNEAGEYGASQWREAPEYPLGIVFDGGIRTIDFDEAISEQATDETPNHDLMWDALAAAATDRREAEYSLSDGIADVRTLLAIERSIRTRRTEFVGE